MSEVKAPAELVAEMAAWLRANTSVGDFVAEMLGRIVMRWHEREITQLLKLQDEVSQLISREVAKTRCEIEALRQEVATLTDSRPEPGAALDENGGVR